MSKSDGKEHRKSKSMLPEKPMKRSHGNRVRKKQASKERAESPMGPLGRFD